MLSTRRSRGSGTQALAHLALLLAACLALALLSLVVFGGSRVQANPPIPPHGDGVHPGGGNGGLDNSAHTLHPEPQPPPPPSDPPPDNPPPDKPPPDRPVTQQPLAQQPVATGASGSTASGLGGVAGASASGRARSDSRGASPSTVIVQPHAGRVAAPARHKQKVTAKVIHAPAPQPLPSAAAAPTGNPHRSTFADRLLSPTQLDLSAKNLGEGGMLALLLAALLYLPVTIFNKATEKNHETIKGWLARPRALLLFLFGWIPFRRHPAITLTMGVVASAVLFSFIEPGFPNEEGALQYLIGMMLGFALVSFVFFATWRLVLRRLEPEGKGEWKLYPPFILLAAFLVVMARLAHFLPGVVLGTVAEYEPAKKLSVRTAGIRVAVTYGVLILLGLAAWFAWIPVEHAASKEGASNLTLILDSALAITFVSGLESVAFGLIPMKFLDGNDLFTWRKGVWAALWGGALLWFSVVILHPALSTYGELSGTGAVWFVLLFSTLMVLALSTWAFFRVRDARLAREAESGSSA
ncbi:MAG: FGLLP motif-containing membrane protein [Solirubrobacterales bacterium]